MKEAKARLVVELTRQASQRLDDLVLLEELNKTTVVNRALNLYYLLRLAAEKGGEITFTDGDSGAEKQVIFI